MTFDVFDVIYHVVGMDSVLLNLGLAMTDLNFIHHADCFLAA